MTKGLRKCFIGSLLLAGSMLFLTGCAKKSNTLSVINYAEYLDPVVIDQFEEDTGIKIKYEEVETPEELYEKYKFGDKKYDVLCTSDYMLERLMNEGELIKADFSSMENTKDVGSMYWEIVKAFDPDNEYVLPYFWGTVGILYNASKTNGEIDSWDALFNGTYSGDIIMPDSMRDAYMPALKYLGFSENTTDKEELLAAQELLIKQKPDVKDYLVDEARDEVLKGKASMAVVYSGDAFYANEESSDFHFCIPKEGSNLWVDCFSITKNCENVENARKFLDNLCREDIAMANFEAFRYSSPFTSVIGQLTDWEKNSDAMNPPAEKLKNCEFYVQLPKDTEDYMSLLWKELRED